MADLPLLPVDAHYLTLSEDNAPKSCDVCGEPADYYVYVTDEMANERLGTDLPADEWLVNTMLCQEHAEAAPRTKSWEDLLPD